MILHNIPPVYDEDSTILILGSFPSVRSRETGFFYGHPQNRFWRLLADIYEEDEPQTIEEKKALLKAHKIALWDVAAACEIEGSSDLSMRDVIPNDIEKILKKTKVRRIFVNGKTAEKYYIRYIEEKTGMKAVCLPSTSPANAAWTYEKLLRVWKIIKEG